MSVKFKSVQRVNPRDLTLPMKYYPQIIYGDDISFEELAEIISKVSSLNYGSVVGTLGTLLEVIEMQLVHGRQVRLGNLGTFYLTMSGTGKEKEGDVSASDINKSTMRFRPGSRLNKLLKTLKYEKVSEPSAEKAATDS